MNETNELKIGYLTPSEVAEAFKISVRTVYAMCKRNDLPYQKIGNSIRIPDIVLKKIRKW